MTKGEARKARKAAFQERLARNVTGAPVVATMKRTRRTKRDPMERWAERYDALNGAPEGDEDR